MMKTRAAMIALLASASVAMAAPPKKSMDACRTPAGSAEQASESKRSRKLQAQVTELQAQVVEMQAQVRQLLAAQRGSPIPAATQLPTPAPGTTKDTAMSGGTMSAEERAKLEAEFAQQLGPTKGGAAGPAATATAASAGASALASTSFAAAQPASIQTNAMAIQQPLPSFASSGASGGSGGRLKLIDISVSLLNSAGGSTAAETELRKLMPGHHDSKNKGFTAQNEELVFSGVVDPHFRADVDIPIVVSEKGETELELEEAYLTTLGLGGGLEVKAGSFFTDFGRTNNRHPHAWEFANQPVIFSRIMSGDNMRGTGARLSWLLPSEDYYKLYLTAQSPTGGPMHSFRSSGTEDGDPQIGGHAYNDLDVRGARDLVYTTRLETSRDLSDEMTIVPGLSFTTGPNATSPEARTNIFGFDFYGKWKPLNNDHGWPFWSWQAEVLWRNFGAASGLLSSDATVTLPAEHINDWGFYAQVVHGFKRQWTTGLRVDYANGSDTFSGPNSADPLRDRRWRFSPNITHYFSEFSKLRYQYDLDVAEHLNDNPEHTFTVQYEVNFGAHGAHKF